MNVQHGPSKKNLFNSEYYFNMIMYNISAVSSKALLLICLIFFYSETIISQTNPADNFGAVPPSPHLSNIVLDNATDVDLNTGKLNVTIPLGEINYFEFNYPVSWTYDASGIMPDQKSGVVGQNWSINCGGSIVRTVRGHDDFDMYPIVADQQYYTRGLFAFNQVHSNFYTLADGPNADEIGDENIFNAINNGFMDTEPDIYHYSFGNYSGTFFLGPTGQVYELKQSGLRISFEYIDNDGLHYINFKIIDPDGFTYLFVENEKTEVKSMTNPANMNLTFEQCYPYTYVNKVEQYVTSWTLSSVESPFSKRSLNFIYGKQYFISEFSNYLMSTNYVESSLIEPPINGGWCEIPFQNISRGVSINMNSGEYLSGVYTEEGDLLLESTFESLVHHDTLNDDFNISDEALTCPALINDNYILKRLDIYKNTGTLKVSTIFDYKTFEALPPHREETFNNLELFSDKYFFNSSFLAGSYSD